MKKQRILRSAFFIIGVLLASTRFVTAATFITFDPPGAVNGSYAQTINAAGVIAGSFADENFVVHGFVRINDGTITTFDGPSALFTEIGGNDLFAPGATTPAGAITGTYFDENFVSHGFLRSSDGTLTTIDAPGAVIGTNAEAINPAGVITGFYFEDSFVGHGFVRGPDGTLTTFDVPGAIIGTLPSGLNVKGTIIGQAFDENSVHGFVRAAEGSFTTFDPSGAIYVQPSDINAQGAITGYYYDADGVFHGFVRRSDGAIATFDAPGAGTGPFQGTSAGAINAVGTITGYYSDADGVFHGFVRSRSGTISTFDVPGSTGTLALAINALGVITGAFFDSNGLPHGFVRTP